MKKEIMETSIRLFGEKGFTETSIQDIVDAIGVTKGTFYYYFNSKQELLKDIHLDYIKAILKQQELIVTDPDKDCKTKMRDIIYMLIQNIRTKRQSARIFLREMRNLSGEHVEQIKQKRDEFRQNFQRLIEKGIEQGEFKSGLRADMITLGILGMTNWSYQWYRPDGDVSEEELVDIYVNMILNGIQNN
ncbi:MAG: TetR/AcrR family transcriptional regulator [Bacillaceae bacterium]|nr:TetR/AcrR family transcriptional regulator [Bacillaceae bacterium]